MARDYYGDLKIRRESTQEDIAKA